MCWAANHACVAAVIIRLSTARCACHMKPPPSCTSASAACTVNCWDSNVRAMLKRCCLVRDVMAASAVLSSGLSTADCRRRTSACRAYASTKDSLTCVVQHVRRDCVSTAIANEFDCSVVTSSRTWCPCDSRLWDSDTVCDAYCRTVMLMPRSTSASVSCSACGRALTSSAELKPVTVERVSDACDHGLVSPASNDGTDTDTAALKSKHAAVAGVCGSG